LAEWEKEVSEFPWSYDEQETCLILSGHAVVDGASGEHAEFGAGDYVIFPVGLQATWKIDETIRKNTIRRLNFSYSPATETVTGYKTDHFSESVFILIIG